MEEYDVIIIGAGLSGLGAAYEAKKRGFSFLVLEAQETPGGRVQTHTMRNGLQVELGAEWIGKDHAELLDICKELGIVLETHGYPEPYYARADGTPSHAHLEVVEKLETLISQNAFPSKEDSLTFTAALKKHFTRPEIKLLNLIYSLEYAAPIQYVSAKIALQDIQEGGETTHMDFHAVGGNSVIIKRLIEYIGQDRLILSAPVTKIQHQGQGALVYAKKKEYGARKVICATGAQALKHIRMIPALPDVKKVARNLKNGDVTKLFIACSARTPLTRPNFSMYSDGPFQYTYITTVDDTKKNWVFCVYSVGKNAVKINRMRRDQIEKQLKKILPKDVFDTNTMTIVDTVKKHWGSDPYTKGAYAVFQPHEQESVLSVLGDHNKTVLFAGEYLSKNVGFMNSALQSGQQAVLRL